MSVKQIFGCVVSAAIGAGVMHFGVDAPKIEEQEAKTSGLYYKLNEARNIIGSLTQEDSRDMVSVDGKKFLLVTNRPDICKYGYLFRANQIDAQGNPVALNSKADSVFRLC